MTAPVRAATDPGAGTTDAPGTRWMGTGAGHGPDAAGAVDAALDEALVGTDPVLVVAFASPVLDLAAVGARVRERVGAAVALIGCTTAGELWTGGSTTGSVVLTVLGGSGLSAAAGLGRGGGDSLREPAAQAAACLDRLERRAHTVLVVLSDGLCGDQMEVVRGAYEVAGAAVPLVGGCAGDDLAMASTRVLCGDEVAGAAVAAAAISSDAPIGIGLGHGWRRVGEPVVVTASSGTRVERLEDRPALEVYLERTSAPPEVATDPERFAAFAVTRPLGIRRRNGLEIRHIAGADLDTGTLDCIAEVPQGALACVTEGDPDSVVEATGTAVDDALAALGGRPPVGLVAFDCVARRAVMAPDGTSPVLQAEIDRLLAAGGGAPVAGFYTYGEIARTRGAGGFHNQTMVVLAVS